MNAYATALIKAEITKEPIAKLELVKWRLSGIGSKTLSTEESRKPEKSSKVVCKVVAASFGGKRSL